LTTGIYHLSISARDDILPSTYRVFTLLDRPIYDEIRLISRYIYKDTSKDIVITGKWSWYEGIHEPFVLIRSWPDGQILKIVDATYAGPKRTQINVTLPEIQEDQVMI
jgi:hypothetical protein